MNYKQILSLLSDIRKIRCEECNAPLEFYSLHDVPSKSGVHISLLCFNCKLRYELEWISDGVLGLTDVKKIDYDNFEEFLRASREG